MRPGNQSNNNKRIRGRGNRKGPNPLSRTYESNGPDVKIRGTAHHVAEKYQQLARDAAAAGDRVMSENYLQHAEHYLRIIAAAQQSMHQPVVLPRGDEAEDEADEIEERNERAERAERNDRVERSDRGERNDRSERNERRDRDRDREAGASSGKPVMPVDAPQPFVDDIPVINTKSLPGESTDTGDEAGEDGDDRSRRRVRGARGRGLRRSRSAQGEGDGSDEAANGSAEPAAEAEAPAEATEEKKPRARRAPRSRKPADAEAAASEA